MADLPVYQPYIPNRKQIRLLRFIGSVKLGSGDDYEEVLACNVQTYDLESCSSEYLDTRKGGEQSHDRTTRVEARQQCSLEHLTTRYEWGDYIAISYTWEPRYPLQKILVNDQVVTIAYSLAEGLMSLSTYLRGIRSDLLVWNDFLCIDQSSKTEIERELKRMSFIFSNACKVISYIGEKTSNSHLVMQRLQAFEGMAYGSSEAIALLESIREQEWVAIVDFLQRPYWRRMWVVQEMAISESDTVLMCGNDLSRINLLWRLANIIVHNASLCHRMMAAALKEDIYFGKLRHNTFSVCARLCSMQRVWADLQQRHRCDVIQIMNVCRGSLQQDARDKVYGILGLLPPNMTDFIEPDLSKSVHAVYKDLAVAIVKATDRLDLLQNCRISSQGLPRFPTWTPDLTISSLSHPIGIESFLNADGGLSSGARFALGNDTLICRGVVLDEIDHLTPPQWPLIAVTEQQHREAQSAASENTIPSLQLTRETLWKTLVGGGESISSENAAPQQYSVLLDMPWLADAAHGPQDVNDMAQTLIDIGWCTANERQDLITLLHFRERATHDFDVCGHALNAFFPDLTSTASDLLDGSHSTPGDGEAANLEHDVRISGQPQDRLYWLSRALRQAAATLKRRRLVVTRRGLLGASVRESGPRDVVVVLEGCNVPMVLRPAPPESQSTPSEVSDLRTADRVSSNQDNDRDVRSAGGDSSQRYMVVGDCYVHGFMNGEAFSSEPKLGPSQYFALR